MSWLACDDSADELTRLEQHERLRIWSKQRHRDHAALLAVEEVCASATEGEVFRRDGSGDRLADIHDEAEIGKDENGIEQPLLGIDRFP